MRHVDERVRRTADWLADGVDPSGAFETVRRKKIRRRIVRRAQTAGLTVAVVLIAVGGVLVLARVFGFAQRPQPVAPTGGSAIAVVRGSDERRDIFLISPSGEELGRLTDGSGVYELPSWSPDGKRIAFIRRDTATELYGLYVMGLDGSGLVKISGDVLAEESRPAWSPDGTRIAFAGYTASELAERDNFVQTDLYVVDVKSGRLTQITAGETIDRDPAWSPGGSRIIFVRSKGLRVEEDPTPEHIPQIYAMARDGSKLVRVTELPGSATDPAWSPDGSRIAFESDGDIMVMNPDGSDVTRLAVLPPPGAGNAAPHPNYGNYEPSWSPDGMQILFVSDRDGDRDLYIMPATGTEDRAKRLTDSPEEEFYPAWQPAPSGDAPPVSVSPSPDCPVLDEETPDLPESYQALGTWSGADVFGDGRPHRARILGDEDRPPRCRYFVVVEQVGGDVFVAPITVFDWLLDVPSPLMSAEIDGEPGVELVVDFGGPMHPHRSGQIFTFKDGSLVQMRLKPSRGVPPMLFPLHDEFAGGVDCAADPGTIVVTVGGFADGGNDDGHYDITRTFYRAEGAVFVETQAERFTVEVGTERERWPELADDSFRSCQGR